MQYKHILACYQQVLYPYISKDTQSLAKLYQREQSLAKFYQYAQSLAKLCQKEQSLAKLYQYAQPLAKFLYNTQIIRPKREKSHENTIKY